MKNAAALSILLDSKELNAVSLVSVTNSLVGGESVAVSSSDLKVAFNLATSYYCLNNNLKPKLDSYLLKQATRSSLINLYNIFEQFRRMYAGELDDIEDWMQNGIPFTSLALRKAEWNSGIISILSKGHNGKKQPNTFAEIKCKTASSPTQSVQLTEDIQSKILGGIRWWNQVIKCFVDGGIAVL